MFLAQEAHYAGMSRKREGVGILMLVVGIFLISPTSPDAGELLLIFGQSAGIYLPPSADALPEIAGLLGTGGLAGTVAYYLYPLAGGVTIGAAVAKVTKMASSG